MKDYPVVKNNGEESVRSKCFKLKGQYYEIGKDVFKVKTKEGRAWLTKDDDNLYYDVDKKQHVAETKQTNSPYHRSHTSGRYVIHDGGVKKITSMFDCALTEGMIKGRTVLLTSEFKDTLKRCEKTGIYHDKDSRPRLSSSLFYRDLNYGYDNSKYIFEKFKEKEPTPIDDLGLGYSYGVELETSTGAVPSDEMLEKGFLAVRDGSTRNYEYVTKPLTQVSSLLPIIESVNNHCEFDVSTSLHCHIGNVPTDTGFITDFYKFAYNMQDSVYKMFPKYKYDNTIHKIKRQNYTQPLPNVKTIKGILTFLNNKEPLEEEYTGEHLIHRADVHRNRKWQIKSRYYWCNLIPLVFNPSRTIEFRIHQGTLNKYKIMYWLLMCMAMVKYVQITGSSDAIDMKEMLSTVYPDGNTAEALSTHYDDMCSYYQNYDEDNDLAYNQDTIDDKEYVPTIKLF